MQLQLSWKALPHSLKGREGGCGQGGKRGLYLWGPKGVQGVEDPPDGVAVTPHLGGQLAITPGPSTPLPCTHAPTHTLARTYKHTRTQARTHARTQC